MSSTWEGRKWDLINYFPWSASYVSRHTWIFWAQSTTWTPLWEKQPKKEKNCWMSCHHRPFTACSWYKLQLPSTAMHPSSFDYWRILIVCFLILFILCASSDLLKFTARTIPLATPFVFRSSVASCVLVEHLETPETETRREKQKDRTKFFVFGYQRHHPLTWYLSG